MTDIAINAKELVWQEQALPPVRPSLTPSSDEPKVKFFVSITNYLVL